MQMVRRHLQLKNLKVPFKHHVNSAFWLSSLYRTLTVTTITSSRYRNIIHAILVILSRHHLSGGYPCWCSCCFSFVDIFVVADPKCNTSPVSATAQPTKTVTVCPSPTQAVHVSATTVTQGPYCSGKSLGSP